MWWGKKWIVMIGSDGNWWLWMVIIDDGMWVIGDNNGGSNRRGMGVSVGGRGWWIVDHVSESGCFGERGGQ